MASVRDASSSGWLKTISAGSVRHESNLTQRGCHKSTRPAGAEHQRQKLLNPHHWFGSLPGTSRSFLVASARSMARSARDMASALVIAWHATRWSGLTVTDHFHTCRPMPWTIEYSMSLCFMRFRRADGSHCSASVAQWRSGTVAQRGRAT